jgi:hypothetical protein
MRIPVRRSTAVVPAALRRERSEGKRTDPKVCSMDAVDLGVISKRWE